MKKHITLYVFYSKNDLIRFCDKYDTLQITERNLNETYSNWLDRVLIEQGKPLPICFSFVNNDFNEFNGFMFFNDDTMKWYKKMDYTIDKIIYYSRKEKLKKILCLE